MGKRISIEIPGLSHQAPIPMGAKIANLVFSSAISGQDPQTKRFPLDADKQAEALFRNIRTFMEQAGGTPDDIVRVSVFLREERYREAINKEWIKMFPDERDRPARHAVTSEIRNEALFQIEIVAVL